MIELPLVLAEVARPPGGLEPFIPLILILVVFYFLLVRPQQKKAKEHENLIKNLKKNDRVVTMGGLHGRIVDLSEHVVTLEVAPNVHVRVDRSQIGRLQKNKKEA
ncbi:MAG: preprotein translocase subunit YajC [Candidatus Dadabacteria bacterium]|nr:MAG: preprotein translocase subunit YajC [Candidatus Dadabacteria bacterium]